MSSSRFGLSRLMVITDRFELYLWFIFTNFVETFWDLSGLKIHVHFRFSVFGMYIPSKTVSSVSKKILKLTLLLFHILHDFLILVLIYWYWSDSHSDEWVVEINSIPVSSIFDRSEYSSIKLWLNICKLSLLVLILSWLTMYFEILSFEISYKIRIWLTLLKSNSSQFDQFWEILIVFE